MSQALFDRQPFGHVLNKGRQELRCSNQAESIASDGTVSNSEIDRRFSPESMVFLNPFMGLSLIFTFSKESRFKCHGEMAQWSSPEPSVLLKHVSQKILGFFRNVLESSSIILRPDDVQLSPARYSSGGPSNLSVAPVH